LKADRIPERIRNHVKPARVVKEQLIRFSHVGADGIDGYKIAWRREEVSLPWAHRPVRSTQGNAPQIVKGAGGNSDTG
jgi:hypothetical protein